MDWDKVLDGVTWFHFSAICPAISQNAADVCKEALEAASRKGITISVDLNYRAKLWQYGKQPIDVMPELAQYCDLIMGNIWAAERMLGVKVDELVTESGQKSLYVKEAQKSSEDIIRHCVYWRSSNRMARLNRRARYAFYHTMLHWSYQP